MNVFSSMRAFVQRPRRLRPPERPVIAEALEQVAGERRRRRHRHRRIVRLPVDGRDVELQLVAGVHQQQLRHAVHADQEVDPEVEIDPAAPSCPVRAASDSPAISTVAVFAARFQRIVNGMRDVFLRLQLGDARCDRLSLERGPLRRMRLNLLLDDRIRRPDQLGSRRRRSRRPGA